METLDFELMNNQEFSQLLDKYPLTEKDRQVY